MYLKNLGSSIDDFLKKENIFEEAQAQAVKEVVVWQLAKAMKKKKISKARMAVLLKTIRLASDTLDEVISIGNCEGKGPCKVATHSKISR